MSPPLEEELIDSHKTQKTKRKADSTDSSLLKLEVLPSEKEKENGILLDDSNGVLIHPARACAVLSRNSKLTRRGAGRLLKWKIGQAWISQLPTTQTMLEVQPSNYIVVTEESWELVKVLMCIKLFGAKFLRVDSILQGDTDSFLIVESTNDATDANAFVLSVTYSFRCVEQIVLSIVPVQQTDGSLKIKDTDLSKIKDGVKDKKPTASFDPKRPSRSNLLDSMIFYKDKLCDNTVEELKYYCKQNLLSVSGTKSFLMSRVCQWGLQT